MLGRPPTGTYRIVAIMQDACTYAAVLLVAYGGHTWSGGLGEQRTRVPVEQGGRVARAAEDQERPVTPKPFYRDVLAVDEHRGTTAQRAG